MTRLHGFFQKQTKNRSSKDLIKLAGRTPVEKTLSNEKLAQWASGGAYSKEAQAEIRRRQKRASKRAANS